MEEKKCNGEQKRAMNKSIRLHCPNLIGDPKLDTVISSFFNQLSNMNYTQISELAMFKNAKDIYEDAFFEATKMSSLTHGNYFAINSLTFFINYRTEVIFSEVNSLD